MVVNVLSTIVIGFGFPLAIGVVGAVGSLLPWGVGDISMALGTWVYDNMKHPKLTKSITIFWMAVTFILTVRYEAKLLKKRWTERGFTGKISADKLSWYSNSVTYAGMLLYFIFGWFLKL